MICTPKAGRMKDKNDLLAAKLLWIVAGAFS